MNKKILITYFTHDGEAYVDGNIVKLPVGNTQVAAMMIQELTSGELFHIDTAIPYPYDHKATVDQAKEELRANARPALKALPEEMASYDVVVVGYPNWWGTMPMAVFAFLENCDLSGKTILPLCTHEGSGLARSVKDLRKTCPDSDVREGLAIVGGSVQSAKPAIEQWLKENHLI